MSRIFWILGRNKRETTPSCSIILPSTLRTNLRTSTYFETEWEKKGKEKEGGGEGKKERGSDLYLHYLTSRPFFFPLLFFSLLFFLARSREEKIYPLPPSSSPPSSPPSAGDSPAGRIDERRSLHRPVEPSVSMCTLKSLPTYLPTYLRST